MDARPYQRYPWPWGQPSILTSRAEEERRQANSWLDADWEEDGSGSDYVPSDSESTGSNATSDSGATSDSSRQDISDSEQADIDADAKAGWPSSPTPSQKKVDQREDLARRVAELVKAEQDAAAAYNPDEVVSLLTQLYELFIAMGHWPEGSLRYPPHADPSVNEQLAQQLGYAPAAVSLMRQLPYLTWKANRDTEIIARTRFADYTREDDLKEGRHPTPYQYLDGCPDLDPWLLPLVLPNNGGWNIMLDTNLGIIRAYNNDASPPQNTIEWRRHGEITNGEWDDRLTWTEYRRAPLVPVARYLSELIYAYRSLSRIPIINPDHNDPKEERRPMVGRYGWLTQVEYESQDTLINLYQECGWPDQWRRAEFLAKWKTKREEITTRARTKS